MTNSPLWRIMVTLALAALMAGAVWGRFNYATASDIDKKIEQAVKPIVDEQKRQGAVLTDIQKAQYAQQVFELQKSILAARKEQCASRRENRSAEYWTEQLARMRQAYRDLTDDPVDVPDCSEL
jgi:hypothetical protein